MSLKEYTICEGYKLRGVFIMLVQKIMVNSPKSMAKNVNSSKSFKGLNHLNLSESLDKVTLKKQDLNIQAMPVKKPIVNAKGDTCIIINFDVLPWGIQC